MVTKRRSKLHKSVTSKSKPNITVTPTTWQNLTQLAKKVKLSKSALVEGIAKGKIGIASTKANIEIDLDRVSGMFNQINNFSSLPTLSNITNQETKLHPTEQSTKTVPAKSDRTLQNQLAQKNNVIEDLRQQLQEQSSQLEQQNRNLQSWQQQLNAKDDQIQERDSLINQLRQQVQEKQFQLQQQNRNLQSWQQQLNAKDEQIQEKNSLISQLEQSSGQLNESGIAQTESNKLKVRKTIFVFILLVIMLAFLLRYYYSHT